MPTTVMIDDDECSHQNKKKINFLKYTFISWSHQHSCWGLALQETYQPTSG